ncbi:MAG TPA: Gfo/Idh/MocA family oxidoreductase [Streptosporangiaceae bacterium]|nr:Gfo/Idh/MocA family oxidoreductase [Streptosporangiaceae bacterium]
MADRGTRHGFGIVGAGVIAATHADAISSVGGARLIAVTDVAAGQAAAFAQARGCAAEPDLTALLSRADIDVVCVCVPSGLHAEVGIAAAGAGKHLVVEKPMDVSLAAADVLIAAARAAGVRMTVISQHRFDPGPTELRRLLDRDGLGRLVLGEAATKWHRTQEYYDTAAWRGTWALDGGSLLNQGIHYADLLRWCMGPVAEVTARVATRAHRMEAEDVALAVLTFASGALGTIVTTTAAFPGSAQRLEITGTGGTVVVEDGEITWRALAAEGPERGRLATVDPAAAADAAAIGTSGHAAQIADLLAAIDAGREPLVTGQDGRDALELARAVYESAREGRTVVLPAASGDAAAAAR